MRHVLSEGDAMHRLFCVVVLIAIPTSLAAQGDAATTKIKILLPREDAKLLIDGQAVEGGGSERSVTIPGGKTTIKGSAVWEPNNYTRIPRTRTIVVTDRKDVVADLRLEDKQVEKDDIVIRFVPTPQDVVEMMCKLAKITKDDVVCDLGCGDGRMVITAVKQF